MPRRRINHTTPKTDRILYKQLNAERLARRQSKTAREQLEYWWHKTEPDERLAFLRWVRIG